MLIRLIFHASLLVLLCAAQLARADIREYVRDYSYQGASFDTRATCRINAIDGVKQELLAELGSYVGSVVKTNQDSLGQSYMSHDVINITAGIVALRLLDEKWNQPVYFVKASMKADPDDVLSKLKAMRADLELEKNLRESYEELEQARKELAELKAQLARLQPTAVAETPARPEPVPVVKRMRQKEEQVQQEIAIKRAEETAVPASTAPEMPHVLAAVPALQPAAAPAARPEPAAQDEGALLADYRRTLQTIEVEAAFQTAMMARAKGDFATMFREMTALANEGYAKAQARLGWMYQRGLGVPQDYQQARAWYEKAGANGLANAIAHVGKLYELGLGVEKDYLKAATLYQRAIVGGSALGLSHLGSLYLTGRGVPLDSVKAAEYFRLGMEQGNYNAMTKLAFLYQKGRGGMEQDKRKAVEFYQKAIDHGDALAMVWLAEMYNEGDGGLPVDHDKALSLLREAERYKQPHAYAFLGFMHENGWSVGQDYGAARRLYEQAAEMDVSFAELRLGILYRDGLGVRRDLDKAAYWLRRAASHGNEKAEKVLNKLTDRRHRF